MAIEWTPEQDSRIREGHAKGESLRTIAKDLDGDINIRHISRRMARMGLTPNGHNNLTAATQATRDRLSAQREHLAALALADALNLRDRMWEEYEIVVNTPDGPRRETLDLPDAKAVSDFTASMERLVKTHENLERIGKARVSDVAKSNLNTLFDKLRAAVGDDTL